MSLNPLKVSFIKVKASETVKARADVEFVDFVLKGFKVISKPDTTKNYVTPPSYFSKGNGWRPLFKTNKIEDWEEIQRFILAEFDDYEIREFTDEVLK